MESKERPREHSASGSKSLRLVLWITQILLAVSFGMAGWMKGTYEIPTLAMYVPWADDVPRMLVRFIGACEFLGALALVLPAATRVKPGLTPLAAALLALTMLFAIGFHIARGETHVLVMPLLLGLLSALVAWGRWSKAPILKR
jgi:putative oxidoreductase